MTRHVKIGEAKTHLSALLAEVEAGEDLVICRGRCRLPTLRGLMADRNMPRCARQG